MGGDRAHLKKLKTKANVATWEVDSVGEAFEMQAPVLTPKTKITPKKKKKPGWGWRSKSPTSTHVGKVVGLQED